MRTLLVLPILALSLIAAACGGGSSSNPTATASSSGTSTKPATSATAAASPNRTSTAAAAPATPPVAASLTPTGGATAAPGTTQSAGQLEVTGIVGSVNTGTRTIEIKQLRGASVTKIEVGDSTRIRKATGGTLRLGDVRTSDRLIASGTLNDRGDALVAAEITVQDVVPGAQPGG